MTSSLWLLWETFHPVSSMLLFSLCVCNDARRCVRTGKQRADVLSGPITHFAFHPWSRLKCSRQEERKPRPSVEWFVFVLQQEAAWFTNLTDVTSLFLQSLQVEVSWYEYINIHLVSVSFQIEKLQTKWAFQQFSASETNFEMESRCKAALSAAQCSEHLCAHCERNKKKGTEQQVIWVFYYQAHN